jgi:hypothetical protein
VYTSDAPLCDDGSGAAGIRNDQTRLRPPKHATASSAYRETLQSLARCDSMSINSRLATSIGKSLAKICGKPTV